MGLPDVFEFYHGAARSGFGSLQLDSRYVLKGLTAPGFLGCTEELYTLSP